jgi:hydroxymethylbilane synthase
MRTLRLATRGSDLARTQSLAFAQQLLDATGAPSELVIVETTGDLRLDMPLSESGVVGLFTSEVQQAVLQGAADFAVHSLKDLPASQTPGLRCGSIPMRENSSDWLLIAPGAYDASRKFPVKRGTVVGTSAARRTAFVRAADPDADIKLLRGNVPTRVNKLLAQEYGAILLAAAGLLRLQTSLNDLVKVELPVDWWPGAPGQGALAVECREDDEALFALLQTTHHQATAEQVHAERGLLKLLGGGCGLPLGAHAQFVDNQWQLTAALGGEDSRMWRTTVIASDPRDLAALAFKELTTLKL